MKEDLDIERIKNIEERMKKSTKIKRFNQKDAIKYLRNL